jgi:methylglutaconyl-CoA hydratase
MARVHPPAAAQLKRVLWEGTHNWDTLLFERAAMSGKLVVSEFTRRAIAGFEQQGMSGEVKAVRPPQPA